jgi:alanine racemase
MAWADSSDKSYAEYQLRRWNAFLEAFDTAGINTGIKHIANSAATLDIPEARCDMVRFGISLYGLQPSDAVYDHSLAPAMAFMTRIAAVKDFEKGSALGYGCTFTTSRKSRIAVLPVGYADGYMRSLSNCGKVIVRGKEAPVVGRVCMDLTLIDVTDIPYAAKGDDVLLFGWTENDSLPAEEIARLAGTINYEIVCAVSKRVPRIYVS